MIREKAKPLSNYHGTAQQRRLISALLPDHISVDERTLSDLLAYVAKYAQGVKFYNLDGLHTEGVKELNWAGLFEKDESVFLATLMATDIHRSDEEIQAAFLNLHQFAGKQQQAENFAALITSLLELTEMLAGWHRKARKLGDVTYVHQIAQEIDQVMQGDLGIQLRSFAEVIKYFRDPETFPEAKKWGERLEQILQQWPAQKNAKNLLSWPNYGKTRFSELLHFAGGRLQEYYRRLYFTLSYISEIAPDLFARSIKEKDDHDPDIGLIIAFLRLFSHAQEALNTLSSRHLEYYNTEVLGRVPRPEMPDTTIVCFQPGQLTEGVLLEKDTLLLAGVNAEGVPSNYRTVDDLYVTKASVGALSTLFVSKNPLVKTNSSYQLVTAIYAAKQANSADGQGMEFSGTDKSWPVLGEDQFDLGATERQLGTSVLGFGIASSILLLKEGERKITVHLHFTPASFGSLTGLLEDIAENKGTGNGVGDVFNFIFNRPFRLLLSGPEGWLTINKYQVIPPDTDQSVLSLEFILPASAAAVASYDPAIHGENYQTPWPVLKVVLSDEEPIYSYSFLRDLELEEVNLEVQVTGLRNLTAYNDIGLLDAARPFVPFGPLPHRNSYLLIGHPELFSKELTSLEIDIDWEGLPEGDGGFAEHYQAYGNDITNDSFKFTLSALTDYSFQPVRPAEREVFNMFTSGLAAKPPLQERRQLKLDVASLKKLRMQPLYSLAELEEFSNTARTGYLKLELTEPKMAFGHALYPRLFARQMAENARPRPFSLVPEDAPALSLPNEPYTPVINRLSVSYSAKTTINLRQLALKSANLAADDRLFRLHPFGTEIVFGGGQLKTTFLLPRFDDDGYLFIGIRDLPTPCPLSLFFNISESRKNSSRRNIDVTWSYLRHGEWQPFTAEQILADNTVQFSTRGIVELFCPADMTKGNGLMDADLHWIRVSAAGNLNNTGRCLEVIPQAVEAAWVNNGDQAHLVTPPADRPLITGLKKTSPGIMGVLQPISFYGGQPKENPEEFYVRGSERLRHKNRAVNSWDYERLVLERFPELQQVKCIGRHGNEDILSLGQVVIVVIPRITGSTTMPRVGYHVLLEIEQYLRSLSGPFVTFRVMNPVYEFIKINCSIKPRDDSKHKQGVVWKQLHDSITRFICPWLQDGVLHLGGSVNKTEVLALINENEHVAFTTAFSMLQVYEPIDDFFKLKDTAIPDSNSEVLTPSFPWSVLVPVSAHNLTFLSKDEYHKAEITAIDGMQLGTDFIISTTETLNVQQLSEPEKKDQEQYFEIPPDWLAE